MSLKNKYHQLSAKSFLLSLGLTLVACGGGNGDGTGYPDISYGGVTTQATVTPSNAADFPVTMLEGSTSSAEATPYAAMVDGGTTQSSQHAAMLYIFTEQVKNNIIAQKNNTDNNIVSAATQPPQAGTCANPGSYTVTDNSTGNNINASITYDNYCVGNFDGTTGLDMTLYGRISFSGSLTQTTPLILQTITMSIEYMKLTVVTAAGTSSEEFSGSLTMTFDGTTNNVVTDMTISTSFQANGLTYKVEGLDIVVDTTVTPNTLNISGRFYHPTHGYVVVKTTEPFDLFSTNPDKYCSGTMELAGNGGVIEFTANTDCTSYDICFTATGDPTCTTPTSYTWP